MIEIQWKGKIGYGDIISPLCYAHNVAQKNCDDVLLHMRWTHKRWEKFKEEDPETLDTRFKELWSICRPIHYHKVHIKQSFNQDLDWNHTNYFDDSAFHNIWFSRVRNQEIRLARPYVVMNTTQNHKQQFQEYDEGKQWKDPVGIDGFRQMEDVIHQKWNMDVHQVDYTQPISQVIDLYRKASLAIGYHGSTMWVARYVGCPMLVYSTKKVTKRAFPWAVVKGKYEQVEFQNINPQELRKKSIARRTEIEKQLEVYLNVPNLHRFRGKRT
jgi:hypothetical protein|tara:strand:- start:317 stop:1126 length:810 start_codon:yes stop_codon:yes gene_type:complete